MVSDMIYNKIHTIQIHTHRQKQKQKQKQRKMKRDEEVTRKKCRCGVGRCGVGGCCSEVAGQMKL